MDVAKINKYVETWREQGYPDDIPDEVPLVLMQQQLAPSYQAIAVAILKNDHALTSLGFSAPTSKWYGILKRIEIDNRVKTVRHSGYETT